MMLKRILPLLALLSAGLWGVCLAQSPRDAILQDPLKAAGTFYVYDEAALPALTPAPEGYEPFYISHFARHGARYCTGEYDAVYGWFTKAAEEGVLTEAGKAFLSRYEPFYQKARYRKGNLTGIGKAQHRSMARRMVERFPAVFAGPTHVEAVSTESPRVIMSMGACLSGLQALDPDIDFDADASACYAPWLQPSLSSNPYLVKNAFQAGPSAEAAVRAYFEATVPWKGIVERFFGTAGVLEQVLKTTPERFISALYAVVAGTRCLDEDRERFDDVFTADELFPVWKGLSARYFVEVARYEGSENLILDYAAFTLGQIIESADADIASGAAQLQMRFGHDSGIAPLLVLLDVNGCGRATSSFEESLAIFPSYTIPMGASLQLVFYRRAGGELLLKVLVNECEATLPLQAAQGPYYRWDDFKRHYLPLVSASRSKILGAEPLP